MHALPIPSVQHRHRATPLLTRSGRVQRLESPPPLYGFGDTNTTDTNNFTTTPAIAQRVSKAWGYNVGSGPIWELVEDRSWFKEECKFDAVDLDVEAQRRPLVYADARVKDGWKILNAQCAQSRLTATSDLRLLTVFQGLLQITFLQIQRRQTMVVSSH